MPKSDKSENYSNANVVQFPQSRVSSRSGNKPLNVIGIGKMACTLGAPKEQMTGHWCNRCRGVWYGFLLEVECPVCGSRHG